MTDLRCTIRHVDGTATTADVTVATPPQTWSPEDAKAFLWAVIRLPASASIYRVSLVDVKPELSWRIEVVTGGGTMITPPLRLSSMARVWLGEAVFEVPWVHGAHQRTSRLWPLRSVGTRLGGRAGVPMNPLNHCTVTPLWEKRSIC